MQKENVQAAKPMNSQLSDVTKRFLEGISNDNQSLGKLKKAIKNGLDSNDILEDGRTLLMHAAMWNKSNICRFLIRRGARIDKKDKENKTAYLIAKELSNTDVCNAILEEGKRMLAKLAGRGVANSVIAAIESESEKP